MSFRLHRGGDPDLLYEFYRRRIIAEDGPHVTLPSRFQCVLEGSQVRERSSVQIAKKRFVQSTAEYGEAWHLVVRCEGGWETEGHQRFALVVELAHEEEIRLYERMRVRVRA